MPEKKIIRIEAGKVTLQAVLNNSKTAESIYQSLPLEGSGIRWGGEFYTEIPVQNTDETGQPLVEKGDLAYWQPGSCLCLFWGPTPLSRGEEIRPASEVIVFGKIEENLEKLEDLNSGDILRLVRV